MINKRQVMYDLERCVCHVPDACRDCSHLGGTAELDCMEKLMADALALLKEQEAKTGKWIEQDGYDGDVYYDCSACGESWVLIDGTPQENGMLYCPHCGAKMDSEVDE